MAKPSISFGSIQVGVTVKPAEESAPVPASGTPFRTLLHLPDKEFVVEAARRGVFAYATDDEPAEEWQNAIEIALRRFAQLHDLESAFAKRAITERAKGILIERHGISEFQALQMVRDRAKLDGGTLVEAAQAIIDGPVPELAPET